MCKYIIFNEDTCCIWILCLVHYLLSRKCQIRSSIFLVWYLFMGLGTKPQLIKITSLPNDFWKGHRVVSMLGPSLLLRKGWRRRHKGRKSFLLLLAVKDVLSWMPDLQMRLRTRQTDSLQQGNTMLLRILVLLSSSYLTFFSLWKC